MQNSYNLGMLKKIYNKIARGTITKKVILSIILISFVSTFISAAILSHDRYQDQITRLSKTFQNIEHGYNQVLSQSLWTFDSDQVNLTLEGIFTYPRISYLVLETNDLKKTLGQKNLSHKNLEHILNLSFQGQKIGTLTIGSDITQLVDQEVKDQILKIISSQFLQTLLLLILSWIFINKSLLKPIKTLNKYTTTLKDVRDTKSDLFFSERTASEFQNLAQIINEMKNSNKENFKKIEDQNKELETYQYDLEKLVSKRTQELELATKKAEEASNVKSQFISNMSHELRTPLNSIILLSDLLKKEIHKEKQLNKIQMINNAGNDLLYLVNDILDLTKIEAGKLNFHYQRFNLSEVIKDVSKLFKIHLKEKSIEFKTNITDNLHITSDKQRISQVLKNLISNAYKFTDSGSICLSLIECKDDPTFQYKITVKDTGIGIKEEDQKRIFNRFEQVETKDDRNFSGSGLGLYISKIILNALESKTELKSTYGQGTTITIYLRNHENTNQTSIKLKPTINENILFNKNVLLVDDDEISLFSISSFLKSKGARIISLSSASKAIQYAQENHDIDFFFLDFMMPEMTGDILTEEIKKIDTYIKATVFILTAASDEKINQKCLNKGATSVINKPLDWKELVQLLQN